MPTIPVQPAAPDVPRTTGIPLRTQHRPAGDLPAVSLGAGNILGNAITEMGQSVQQGAELTLRTAEIEARAHKAQRVLDAKTKLQDYVLRLDQEYDTLQQGDYRTLPESTIERGRALMDEMTQGLHPQTAALFKEDAAQRLAVVQQKALAERTQRRDSERLFTQSRAKDQARVDFERATTTAEQTEAMVRYEQLNLDLVRAGLLRGDVAAQDVAEMRTVAHEVNATRWLEADPARALEHTQALLDGKPGLENAPAIPAAKVKAYHDMAEKELRETINTKEAHDREQTRQRVKAAEGQLQQWDAAIADPRVSGAQLAAHLRTLNQMAANEQLPDEVYRPRQQYVISRIHQQEAEARAEARAARTEASQQRMEARQLQQMNSQRVLVSQLGNVYGTTLRVTPEDILRLPGAADADPGMIMKMMNDVRDRQRQDHVSNQREFKLAVEFGESQILGPASDIVLLESSGVTELQDLAKRRKENLGQYQAELYRTAVEMSGPQGVDTRQFQQDWESISRTMVERYKTMGAPPRPPVGFETPEAIVNAFQAGRITEKSAKAHMLLLKTYTDWESQQPKTPPPPGGKK